MRPDWKDLTASRFGAKSLDEEKTPQARHLSLFTLAPNNEGKV